MLRFYKAVVLDFVMILLLSGCVTNGVNGVSGSDGTGTSTSEFDRKVLQVMEGKETPDLAALRSEYVTTEYYNPWETTGILQQMKSCDEQKDYATVIRLTEEYLNRFFVNIEFHYLAMKAYKNTGVQDKYLWHRKMLYDIIQEIMARGDGKTREKAYAVISVSEEYVIMNFLGLRYSEQSAFSQEGHFYEKFNVEPNEFYQARQIYFNVDVPMLWLETRKEG